MGPDLAPIYRPDLANFSGRKRSEAVVAKVMVNFLAALIGHVKGGLSYVLLGAMYLVSGISGSKAADMAAVAPILFPEMRRRGAHPGELASLLATSSAMSETIPPSLVLITIGSVTNISIAALFTGGLLPAAVAALGLVVVAWFRSRNADRGAGARAPAGQILRTFVIGLMAEGWSEADILANFPGVTHDDILACLAYARDMLSSEKVFPSAA